MEDGESSFWRLLIVQKFTTQLCGSHLPYLRQFLRIRPARGLLSIFVDRSDTLNLLIATFEIVECPETVLVWYRKHLSGT